MLNGYQRDRESVDPSDHLLSPKIIGLKGIKNTDFKEKLDVKIKKKNENEDMEKKMKNEIASGISQYPELSIQPVKLTPDDEAYKNFNRKSKKLFTI